MMGNIRDIKNRIESIKNTRQITNAMKMVAAAKLRKSQNLILNARPYADHINRMLTTIKYKDNNFDDRIFKNPDKNAKKALVVVTADRGLCGSFNSMIIKAAIQNIENRSNTDLFCIGKKGYDIFKKHSVKLVKHYTGLFNEMDFSVSALIATEVKNLFYSGEYDQIDIIYNEFKTVIQQNIIQKTLLPVPEYEEIEGISKLDYLYEPSQEKVIEELIQKYIDVEVWRVLLDSSAAEQAARMTAMDSATDNASELIESLSLEYNMVRQAAITTEIIEISSGAEAQNQ
jgi:F-type H+-transporting ATPase subunit gamma